MKYLFLSGALIASAAFALPSSHVVNQALTKREGGEGGEGANGIIGLVMLIEELVQNEKNAYDPDVKDSFVVSMGTRAGTNCSASVQPASSFQDGWDDLNPHAQYDTLTPISGKVGSWNVCYVGGRQYFHDTNIGDFSITFSKAGGVNGDKEDGLHSPILQVASIGNWQPIDVEGLSQADGNKLCEKRGSGDSKQLVWSCGIPRLGGSFFGLTNQPPITAKTYAKGWCSVHFVQHQIPSGGSKYGLSVLVKDAKQQPIGMLGDPYTTGNDDTAAQLYNSGVPVDSVLPYTLDVNIGSHDDDPVSFAYGGQTWNTGSNNGAHACKVGKYDSGARQGDCGFTC